MLNPDNGPLNLSRSPHTFQIPKYNLELCYGNCSLYYDSQMYEIN